MRIWIDLVNSPHVAFFSPLIKRLESDGHQVILTYRDFAQTKPLVRKFGLKATLIDGHGGKSKIGKILSLLKRTVSLVKFAKEQRIDVAVSHNSYFQIIAAKILGVPSLTSMDFEGQPANHLAFRLADRVCLPDAFPEASARKFGAKTIVRYPGLKEDICLSGFNEEKCFRESVKQAFNLTDGDLTKPVVVVRPPPSLALYHNNENSLFDLFLSKLDKEEVTVLVLPRVKSQQYEIEERFSRFNFSETTLDGLQLVNFADYVASGGGSMNREAACLGTPAISLFSGELPEIDKLLQNQGKLSAISTPAQVDKLTFVKKESITCEFSSDVLDVFLNHVKDLYQQKAHA